ncbi:MAG: hypothetical protein ACLFVO_19875 [Chloroflexaceae bacterium]|jgi:hypothetical protein
MHSDLIGKIEKARRYAQEPERLEISELKMSVRGDNDTTHNVTLSDGSWDCTCSFFHTWGTCAHVMAAQRLLTPVLTPRAREAELAIDYQRELYKEEEAASLV